MAKDARVVLFWVVGGAVMLLLLVANVAFFSVVVSLWLRLFAGVPLNGRSLAIRFGAAVVAMALVALLMEGRRRL